MMEISKKKMGAFSMIMASSALLFACSGSGSTGGVEDSEVDEDGVTHISLSTWGIPAELKVMEELVTNFEEENPDINVNLLHIPDDYTGKMNTMLAGGTAPDVVFASDGDFGGWARAGLFLDIQEMAEESTIDLDDMWDTALDRYRWDGSRRGQGNLHALPKDIGPSAIYYNKDLFDEAGVEYPDPVEPMTWDELLETAKALTDAEKDQFGLGPIWWEGFVWSNGGEFLSEDLTEFILHEEEGVEALQFVADLTNVHKVAPNSHQLDAMDADQMFETGRIAMNMAGRWMVPDYREMNFDWDVAPMPQGPTGISTNWSGSVGYAINDKTNFPEASFKLVEYLAGERGQEIQTELGFAIPTYESLAETDVFLQPDQKPANAEAFIIGAKTQRPGPWNITPNNRWLDELNQNLGDVMNGERSAEEVLNEIQPAVQEFLEAGNPEIFGEEVTEEDLELHIDEDIELDDELKELEERE
ncbi:ABC transporter substrate-binding protein [Salipaludibacillus sp. CF4.18]|uniref:ABC transporter substrate-binding protein n=1 Tax=Salipaludibacillus sp. CF4.18 TaxID=3373081 RepID=UPI003EE55D02